MHFCSSQSKKQAALLRVKAWDYAVARTDNTPNAAPEHAEALLLVLYGPGVPISAMDTTVRARGPLCLAAYLTDKIRWLVTVLQHV